MTRAQEYRADANAADAVQKEKRKYYCYGKAAEIKTGFDGFVGLIQYDGQFLGRKRSVGMIGSLAVIGEGDAKGKRRKADEEIDDPQHRG